ncbi:hypothetical protein BCR42DRAFT_423108 [Absidia repens]|uniref:Uncharacterized protein n=1 Tax=Absidia repens TaxID=90262 RepID=A0A1X2I5M4_9FUNG|nr:hypothetical protein BCR42DRAFT_423108 [Absidia repens]
MYFWESPAVQATGINEYMFMTALAASTCSTGALHFLLSPFISNIYLHTPPQVEMINASNSNTGFSHGDNDALGNPSPSINSKKDTITPKTTITLETMDIFARPKHTTVQLGDLKPTTRFLLTWTCTPKYLARHPDTSPGRFLLDRRGGVGDPQAMRQIFNVIQNQDRRQRVL